MLFYFLLEISVLFPLRFLRRFLCWGSGGAQAESKWQQGQWLKNPLEEDYLTDGRQAPGVRRKQAVGREVRR